ncbi:MAG: hypothetical protein OMM_07250, partial [Candidatus Magnetoglobus multicellularis str. Araruama]
KRSEKLFLQTDSHGKNRYTFREIAELLKKKFDYKVSFQTVQRWANDENDNWYRDLEILQQQALNIFGDKAEAIYIDDYASELKKDYDRLTKLKEAGFRIAENIIGVKRIMIGR